MVWQAFESTVKLKKPGAGEGLPEKKKEYNELVRAMKRERSRLKRLLKDVSSEERKRALVRELVILSNAIEEAEYKHVRAIEKESVPLDERIKTFDRLFKNATSDKFYDEKEASFYKEYRDFLKELKEWLEEKEGGE